MAHKSKTQRAKASEKRAAKKAMAAEEQSKLAAQDEEEPQSATSKTEKKAEAKQEPKKAAAKPAEKPKKAKKPGFLKEVRSEMKRVTWPTKQDVLRWSGVVVVALVFFSVFVLVLDNFIVTPVLLGISSLGA